jgi:hypothetical protein
MNITLNKEMIAIRHFDMGNLSNFNNSTVIPLQSFPEYHFEMTVFIVSPLTYVAADYRDIINKISLICRERESCQTLIPQLIHLCCSLPQAKRSNNGRALRIAISAGLLIACIAYVSFYSTNNKVSIGAMISRIKYSLIMK